MSRIAILDCHEHDPGLKILFPEADYYVFMKGCYKGEIYNKHNICPHYHDIDFNIFDKINDTKYDSLMIVCNIYDGMLKYNGVIKTSFFKDSNLKFLDKVMLLLLKNNFKNVFLFDNYDYNYDPNIISDISDVYEHIIKTKNLLFFKRNFTPMRILHAHGNVSSPQTMDDLHRQCCYKAIEYKQNVFPFPYIMFGKFCNIDTIISTPPTYNERIPRVFFSGTLFDHEDPVYGIFRNRRKTMEKITRLIHIDYTNNLPHDVFLSTLSKYKYALDLLGVGDPNIRTFEILSSNSLRIAERSNLTWNFDDDFCEETYFSDEIELVNKLLLLENNPDLYTRCLEKQKYIVSTYMNVSALRNYISEKMK